MLRRKPFESIVARAGVLAAALALSAHAPHANAAEPVELTNAN